jgi:starch phosphorylase
MTMSEINQFLKLPERIRGLGRLAYNLWWSWNPPARAHIEIGGGLAQQRK